MLKRARVKALNALRGCSAGLDQRTALVEVEIDGDASGDWSQVEPRLRRGVQELRSEDPVLAVAADGWPGDLLVECPQEPGLAHWIAALTVALQRSARQPVWRGRVIGADAPVLRLALPYEREGVLRDALQLALRQVLLWSQPAAAPEAAGRLAQALQQWLDAAQRDGLSPNAMRFVHAAWLRGIPVAVMPGHVQLGWGANAQRMDSSLTGRTSSIAVRTARDKHLTGRLLGAAGIPVPPSALVRGGAQALEAARKLGWPVVVKPSSQDQGIAVVPGIGSEALLQRAFDEAARYSPGGVIVQKHVDGDDHRLLVVGGRLLMATRRSPGGVTGDGVATVRQLVERVNADPRRGTDKRSLMMAIGLDEEAVGCLAEQGLTAEAVPEVGRFVRLRRTANISRGGSAQDVSARVHPDNRGVCERAARIVGLDIAGVDFICPDISKSWREVGGAICEVNAMPGFRPHWLGDPQRDVNGEIVDWLFEGRPARIPTVAITGTNGKSTVAKMLHHIWMASGKVAGVTTTAGTWVGSEQISYENLSGQGGGRLLLNDPAVEAAVIEMPRKGLVVLGHACDRYDVAALLNVQDDHLGVYGIETLEDMARLKAEVLERAREAVVVNAEDRLSLAMRARSPAPRQILVAREANAPALQAHLAQGGEAVFAEPRDGADWIVRARGDERTPWMPLAEIPATMNGLIRFNEINALFAAALAWAQGIAPQTIRAALRTFANTVQQNPGRYNFIDGFPFRVMLDYGHNPDGVRGVCEVARKLPVAGKRRIVTSQIGNRHRAHVGICAPMLAADFDSFVISQLPDRILYKSDYRGEDRLAQMLAGFVEAMKAQGVADSAIEVVPDQTEAIRRGLAGAQPGDLVVLLVEPWVALPLLDAIRAGR